MQLLGKTWCRDESLRVTLVRRPIFEDGTELTEFDMLAGVG